MKRQVVFVGNCQAETLCVLYCETIAPATGDQVDYVATHLPADETAIGKIGDADILVRQVLNFATATDELQSKGRTVLVPLVSAPFLWPCSGRPHPKNKPEQYFDATGPYDAELGDSFLDLMIKRGVPAAEAVADYAATDIASVRNVDRIREITMDQQRIRDAACGGYTIASLLDSKLSSRKLFRTANHPERPLTLNLAEQVFERIGLPSELITNIYGYDGQLFPANEAPIHPSIARRFDLHYVQDDTLYKFHDEGGYTWQEWNLRYMNYLWNADLRLGMHLRFHGEPTQAISVLRRAIAASPRSAVAHSLLSELLVSQGQLREGVVAARSAATLEPANKHFGRLADYYQSLLDK